MYPEQPGESWTLFQGHTRFATSSICNLGGCHPHQWLPCSVQMTWRRSSPEGAAPFIGEFRNVESYITHNGDLDFFEIHGCLYSLTDVQCLLTKILGREMPSDVDSACIAGLLDLLRTMGIWHASVRYGYLFGALAHAGNLSGARTDHLACPASLGGLTALFEQEWVSLLRDVNCSSGDAAIRLLEANPISDSEVAHFYSELLCERMLVQHLDGLATTGAQHSIPLPGVPSVSRRDAVRNLITSACKAFFFGDLLRASLELLAHAHGSFGLVLSHSLDAQSDLVIASRGQTMSISFYPSSGLILFGSEAAATKVNMGHVDEKASFRVDLDDVGGEVVLLRHAHDRTGGRAADCARVPGATQSICCGGEDREATEVLFPVASDPEVRDVVLCVNILQHNGHVPLWRRRLILDGNRHLTRIPDTLSSDAVAQDLLDIPAILERLTTDFLAVGPPSPNRISAWTFTSKLRQRLQAHRAGTHDGAVDLLITGCEVSLWLGEQFAADIKLVYPKLSVEVLSANKLLGQLGQTMPMPQAGFRFNMASHNFRQTIVLVLTHSGGTFAPLACCSLLRGYTPNIFVVTSELDTQAARAVRSAYDDATPSGASDGLVDLCSQYVFSTHAGFRPAEPCTLSIAAMHHLLSQLLLFLMGFLAHFEHGSTCRSICGSSYNVQEVRELVTINLRQPLAAKDLIGQTAVGDTAPAAALRKQGQQWAHHVLEGPLSWMLSFVYIGTTLLLGVTPIGALTGVAIGTPLPAPLSVPAVGSVESFPAWVWGVRYLVAIIDTVIYAFLPWWTTVLIRLLQRRPWLHRVSGRSVLIGDVPWVAQSVEAFASKLFALSYSIASCTFASANPADHLVHRHTHRVVRGSLLAVGRPDGRANALTTAEAACTLSVNQASSIQNFGVTCESITIGHSAFRLPLSSAHLVLPTQRPPFACEVLGRVDAEGEGSPSSRNTTPCTSPNPSLHGGNKYIQRHGPSGGTPTKPFVKREPSVHDGLHTLMTDTNSSTDESHDLQRRPGGSWHGGSPLSPLFIGANLVGGLSHGAARKSGGSSWHGGTHFARRDSKEAFVSHLTMLNRLASGSADDLANLGSRDAGVTPCVSRNVSKEPSMHGPPLPCCLEQSVLEHSMPSPAHVKHSDELSGEEGSTSTAAVQVVTQSGGRAASPTPSFCSAMSSPNSSRESSTHAGGHVRGRTAFCDVSHELTAPLVHYNAIDAPSIASPPPSPPLPWSRPAAQTKAQARVASPRARILVKISSAPRTSTANAAATAERQSPSAVRATYARVAKRSRRALSRASGAFTLDSLSTFKIEPIAEPFLGAWMLRSDQFKGLNVTELMQRQHLVQTLSENRFDALQRLIAFFVLFHTMGKAVADFWPLVSCGLLGYSMSRTQSIMRVATTASPVSAMEVRERMLAIRAETRRICAARSIQHIWRAISLTRLVKAKLLEKRKCGNA